MFINNQIFSDDLTLKNLIYLIWDFHFYPHKHSRVEIQTTPLTSANHGSLPDFKLTDRIIGNDIDARFPQRHYQHTERLQEMAMDIKEKTILALR